MNVEQLSIQLTAINDAVQLLARSKVTLEYHGTTIEGLVKKNNDYDARLRDIESLIHQSCDLKSKEFNEVAKDLYDYVRSTDKDNRDFTKYVAGALAVAGSIAIAFIWNNDANQDANSEKVFKEFTVALKDLKESMSSIRENLAVLSTNQSHYQKKLDDHMIEELESRKGK